MAGEPCSSGQSRADVDSGFERQSYGGPLRDVREARALRLGEIAAQREHAIHCDLLIGFDSKACIDTKRLERPMLPLGIHSQSDRGARRERRDQELMRSRSGILTTS